MVMEDRDAATHRVIENLKKLYKEKLLPLENLYSYAHFFSQAVSDAEFDAKPMVLMIGQYSTGKTSFIKYLLGRDFPGQRIGPEPTTDRFVCVMNHTEERVVPGNALSVAPDLPFSGLQQFGVSFLNKLEGSQIPSPVLRNISIVDTPGILSGEKQRLQRGYDFVKVCGWFAERCDLILLLFDAHKLDISDEFRTVIESLKNEADKIRCVLNKADQVDRQKLMRVYGALMWAMGKVTKTPEVLRVFTGSFWDQPLHIEDNAKLFEKEERDLMADLKNLPRNSAVRKINDLVKRTRKAKVHAYIIAHLRSEMPSLSGKQKKQEKLLNDLGGVFKTVMKKHNLAYGDFPEIDSFRLKLAESNFSKFPKLNMKLIDQLDQMLNRDIPQLMDSLPAELHNEDEDGLPGGRDQSGKRNSSKKQQQAPPMAYEDKLKMSALNASMPAVPTPANTKFQQEEAAGGGGEQPPPPPNPFGDEEEEDTNPFGDSSDDDDGVGEPPQPWDLEEEKAEKWDPIFVNSGPVGGALEAGPARTALMATGVPKKSLRKIWELSDIDKDGKLDAEEFAVAMHLCTLVGEGGEIPEELDVGMVPILKRK